MTKRDSNVHSYDDLKVHMFTARGRHTRRVGKPPSVTPVAVGMPVGGGCSGERDAAGTILVPLVLLYNFSVLSLFAEPIRADGSCKSDDYILKNDGNRQRCRNKLRFNLVRETIWFGEQLAESTAF
ncbi:hypothetical protein CEXT_307831 [Caerostris extrusa]|uniref:Uncharacterized protein n=1 Tax=Caerostris extrusa TaxID=172846 RepID=A0AAV4XGR9_CAEEX|nr:hypothetical protein CEXT_307831 [Caerostris extrusa]